NVESDLHLFCEGFSMRIFAIGSVFLFSATMLFGARTCYSPGDALSHQNKDVCVSAHIYDVVELSDGTRFLDVCSPQTPDDQCRFTVVSLGQDRDTVGELSGYPDKDVQLRGVVEPMKGRSGIALSHIRQFSGGPPRFRPNPLLVHGF